MSVSAFVVPTFDYRQLPINYSIDPGMGDRSLGLVQHVAVGGNFSLYGWFSNPAAKASSTWWVGKNKGQREQYMNPDIHRSWAQAAGNPSYHSVETAGNPEDPLTDAQIESEAVIYAAGVKRYGWPYRLAEHPGEKGFGWHGMGGAAWGGHYDCPGVLRREQRSDVLRLAEKINAGPTPAPTTEGLFGMSDFERWSRRKLKLQRGKWATITLSDANHISVSIGPGLTQCFAHTSVDLPPGATLQGRFYEVDYKKGEKTRRAGNARPSLELTSTSGQSWGTVPYMELVGAPPKGWSRRVRLEYCLFGADEAEVIADIRRVKE